MILFRLDFSPAADADSPQKRLWHIEFLRSILVNPAHGKEAPSRVEMFACRRHFRGHRECGRCGTGPRRRRVFREKNTASICRALYKCHSKDAEKIKGGLLLDTR